MTRVLQTPLQPPPTNRLTWLPGSILPHESLLHVLQRVAWLNGARASVLVDDFGRGLPLPLSLDSGNQVFRLAALAKAMGEPRNAFRTCDLALIPTDSWRFLLPELRFCPRCTSLGYHSRLFSLKPLTCCPWHGDRLISCGCRSRRGNALSAQDTLIREQCDCGLQLYKRSLAIEPKLDASAPHVFDDVVEWLITRSQTSFEGPRISHTLWPSEALRQHVRYCSEAAGICLPDMLRPTHSIPSPGPCVRIFDGPTVTPDATGDRADWIQRQSVLDREAETVLDSIRHRLRHQFLPRRVLFRHLVELVTRRDGSPELASEYIGTNSSRRIAWAFWQWARAYGQDHLIRRELRREPDAFSRHDRWFSSPPGDDGLREESLPECAAAWIKRHLVAERAMLTWVSAQSRPVSTFALRNGRKPQPAHPIEQELRWSMAYAPGSAARLQIDLPWARSTVFRPGRQVKTSRPVRSHASRQQDLEDLFLRPALRHSDTGWTVVSDLRLESGLSERWIRKHRLLHAPGRTTYFVVPAGSGYVARARHPAIEGIGNSPGEATEALRVAVRKYEEVAAYLPDLRDVTAL